MKFGMNSTKEIDRSKSKNVGITSLMKGYTTFSNEIAYSLHNAEFIDSSDTVKSLMIDDGHFKFCASLLVGFCEDYKRVVINARHELILIRAHNGNNYIVGDLATKPTLKLQYKVQLRMPHVALNEINKLSMLRALESERYLSFHSWDLYEYPLLPSTTKHFWAIKTATQLEKLRYVIFGQIDKKIS